MWGKKEQRIEFDKCPMYERSHANGTKLSRLETEVLSVTQTIEKFKESLEAHMVDEVVHHQKSNDAINSLATSVTGLVADQLEHRKTRDERDKKVSMLLWRVGGSILTVISIAVGSALWNLLTHVEEINKVINGGG